MKNGSLLVIGALAIGAYLLSKNKVQETDGASYTTGTGKKTLLTDKGLVHEDVSGDPESGTMPTMPQAIEDLANDPAHVSAVMASQQAVYLKSMASDLEKYTTGPMSPVQRAMLEKSIAEQYQGDIAPETVDWKSVAKARAASAAAAPNAMQKNNSTYAANALQGAIAAGLSPAALNLVAKTNRTDYKAVETQVKTGIPPQPPQALVDRMVRDGQPLPDWLIKYYGGKGR